MTSEEHHGSYPHPYSSRSGKATQDHGACSAQEPFRAPHLRSNTGINVCRYYTRRYRRTDSRRNPLLRLSFWARSDIIADPHTAAAVRTVGSKLVAFRAGLYCHAVGGSNFYDLFSESQALLLCDLSCLREVPSDLGIEVNETERSMKLITAVWV